MSAIVQKDMHQSDMWVTRERGYPYSETRFRVALVVARAKGHRVAGGPVQRVADKKHSAAAGHDFAGEKLCVGAGEIPKAGARLDFEHWSRSYGYPTGAYTRSG